MPTHFEKGPPVRITKEYVAALRAAWERLALKSSSSDAERKAFGEYWSAKRDLEKQEGESKKAA